MTRQDIAKALVGAAKQANLTQGQFRPFLDIVVRLYSRRKLARERLHAAILAEVFAQRLWLADLPVSASPESPTVQTILSESIRHAWRPIRRS